MSCLTSKIEHLLGLNKSKRKTRKEKRRFSGFLNTKRKNNKFRRKRKSRRIRRRRR